MPPGLGGEGPLPSSTTPKPNPKPPIPSTERVRTPSGGVTAVGGLPQATTVGAGAGATGKVTPLPKAPSASGAGAASTGKIATPPAPAPKVVLKPVSSVPATGAGAGASGQPATSTTGAVVGQGAAATGSAASAVGTLPAAPLTLAQQYQNPVDARVVAAGGPPNMTLAEWDAAILANPASLASSTPTISSLGPRRAGDTGAAAPPPSAEQQQRDARTAAYDSVQVRAAALAEQMRLGPAANRLPRNPDVVTSASGNWTKSQALAGRTLKELEVIHEAERKMQVSTGGRYFDAKYSSDLMNSYVRASNKLAQDKTTQEREMQALWDAGHQKEAAALYNSPAYQALVKEFARVNGSGRKQGSAVPLFQSYNDAVSMQAQFLAGIFAQKTADERRRRSELLNGLDPGEPQSTPIHQFGNRIDPSEGPADHRTPQTMQEVAATAQARYEIALREQRAQHDAEIAGRKRLGLTADGNDPQELALYKELADAARVAGLTTGGNGPQAPQIDVKTPDDVERLVDTALAKWDQLHRPTSYDGATQFQQAERAQATQAARDIYERQLFGLFGTSRRSVLEKTVELPGIKEGLAALNFGLGAIGTAVRETANSTFGGELVGPGLDISKFDPAAGFNRRDQSPLGPFSFVVDPITSVFTSRPGTVAGFGIDTSTEAKLRAAEASQKFHDSVGSAIRSGNIYDAVKAVGDYGSTPFSSDSSAANLAFQIVADPLNFVPLNFLTYGARFAHAAENSAARSGISRAAGFVKDFATVTEPELRLKAHLGDALAGLGAKNADDLGDQLMREVQKAGHANVDSTVQRFLEDHGLVTTAVNARQLNTLVQDQLHLILERQHVGHVWQGDVAKAAAAEREAAAKIKVAEREAADKAAARKLAEVRAAKTAELDAARKRLEATRAAEAKAAVRAPAGVADAARKAGMSEERWLIAHGREVQDALRAATTDAEKNSLRAELRSVNDALDGVRVADGGGHFVSWQDEQEFARQVDAAHGSSIQDLYPEKRIAPYAENDAQAMIEQARSLRRTLETSSRRAGELPAGPVMTHTEYVSANAVASKAISEYRGRVTTGQSHIGRLRTSEKGPSRGASDGLTAGEMKARDTALRAAGYDPARYSVAHSVLRDPMLARNANAGLIAAAKAKGGDFTAAYRSLRSTAAKNEARVRLKKLAASMYGHTPGEVLQEFTDLHTYTGQAAKVRSLTPEQVAVLSGAFKELTGVAHNDLPAVQRLFDRGGVVPPLSDRVAMRSYMERVGAWSPREITDILEGQRVWSLSEEAAFWHAETGRIPPWADVQLMRDRGIFDDYSKYQQFQREVGGYNDDLARSLAAGRADAKAFRDRVIEGSPGVKERADIAQERRFLRERYGDAVYKDGHFTAMPWVMSEAEIPPYYADLVVRKLEIPRDLVPETHLPALKAAIEKASQKYMAKARTLAEDAPLTPQDFLRFGYDITDDLLATKEWLPLLAKQRGPLGARVLNGWSEAVRATVTWHPAFLIVNTPDVLIRGAWFRFAGRHIMSDAGEQAIRRALEYINPDFTSFYSAAGRKGLERVRNPLQTGDRARGLFEAFTQAPGELAGRLETARKRSLAAKLYQSAYDEAVTRLTARGVKSTDKLADAVATSFMKKEIDRLFPTMEHAGPAYKLFNELTPFFNYQLRNRVLWISQTVAHPAMLAHIEHVGDEIRHQNLILWKKNHPNGEPMPEYLQTRIPLPWAPDTFMDLSVLTDIGRGLSLFDTGKKRTLVDWASQYIRLVSPTVQAAAIGLTDGLGITGRWVWIPDANGVPQRVWRGLGEPWSGDPVTVASLFWPADALDLWNKLQADGKIDAGDIYQMLSKLAFYSEFARVSPARALSDTYWALREKDRGAAQAFLDTHPEIRQFWNSQAARPQDFMLPTGLKDAVAGLDRSFLQRRGPEYRQLVGSGFAGLSSLESEWDRKIAGFVGSPFDPRLADLKAGKRAAIAQYMLDHPELIEYSAYTKTNAEWAAQLAQWQVDEKIDQFHHLLSAKPVRTDFKTDGEYKAAVADWEHQKATFLAAFPQVASTLANGRSGAQAALDALHQDWVGVFARTKDRAAEIKRLRLDRRLQGCRLPPAPPGRGQRAPGVRQGLPVCDAWRYREGSWAGGLSGLSA